MAFVTDGLDLADYDGCDDLQLGYSLDEAAYEQLYSCVCDYEQYKELVLDLSEKCSRCEIPNAPWGGARIRWRRIS